MFNASENRARLSLVAAIFTGLVLVVVAARFDRYFRSPMLELGDIAVNALQVDNAKHFSELYGNYSRFEFNHPGPVVFYVYAAAEWLFHDLLHVVPSPTNAHLLACLALQGFFFALAIAVIGSHLRWRALVPLALLAGAVYFGWVGDALVSIWPPHMLVMPFLCFLACCVSIGSGRISDWPLAVLTGGFLFHGHVAQPLFIGLLGTLALALTLRRLRPAPGGRWREVAREHRGLLVRCGVIAFIFLTPVAIDVLVYGTEGNIATIIGRFRWGLREHISAFKSLLYFLSFGTAEQNQYELLAVLRPETGTFFAQNAWRIAAWVAVFVVPPVLAFRSRTLLTADERRFFLAAGAFLAASVVGCILWGKSQAGGMHNFNGYFYYGIYFFALLLALALVARGLQRFPRAPVSLLLIAAVVVTWRAHAIGTPAEGSAGLTVQRGVAAALAADPDPRTKLLVFEHAHWPDAAAVALDLQRRDVGFYVMPWWNFMFQRRHDLTRLGPVPEDQASVWWIGPAAAASVAITKDLGIHLAPAAIRPDGDAIRLQTGANGFRYVLSGVSVGNDAHVTTNLPRAVFRFAPQTAAGDVHVVFDAEAIPLPGERVAEIYFNGEAVGRVTAGKRAATTVRIPAALWNRRPVGTLELRFPDATPHHDRERPSYQWWLGWNLWSIRFEIAPATG